MSDQVTETAVGDVTTADEIRAALQPKSAKPPKVKKAKAPKQPKAKQPRAPAAPRVFAGGRGTLPEDYIVRFGCDRDGKPFDQSTNLPCRAGTQRAGRWSVVKVDQPVKATTDAGLSNNQVRMYVDRGWLVVESPHGELVGYSRVGGPRLEGSAAA